MVQPRQDAAQIADTVAIAVGKGARIEVGGAKGLMRMAGSRQ